MFTRCVASLIGWATSRSYALTFGEAWRAPETALLYAKDGRGISNSLHIERLAVDLNAFKDGRYLSRSEDYAELGAYWESLSNEEITCHWGGRFGDGNHFSIGHAGRK